MKVKVDNVAPSFCYEHCKYHFEEYQVVQIRETSTGSDYPVEKTVLLLSDDASLTKISDILWNQQQS